jgi:hypothetical protein
MVEYSVVVSGVIKFCIKTLEQVIQFCIYRHIAILPLIKIPHGSQLGHFLYILSEL